MPVQLTTNPAVLGGDARFVAPLAALEAITIRTIVSEATEDGVDEPGIHLHAVEGDAGQAEVACRVEMALRLLCAWMEVAAHTPNDEGNAPLLRALRTAAVAVYAAYDAARDPERISVGEFAHVPSSFK